MKIGIIGTGYVGLVTGACFADLGNEVICVDIDRKKIEGLKKGIMPIFEPGMDKLVKRNLKEGRLSFTTQIRVAVKDSQVIFICVGTPPKPDGEADLTYVENVAIQIARWMKDYRLVVEKSTVPVETGEWVKRVLKLNRKTEVDFDVASNPEFLREGSAVYDFMHPDRIVLGLDSKRARDILTELYKPLNAPLVITDIRSAELIKHASNSFLATKISFINALSQICEKVNADVEMVAEGMGLDKRIGPAFLNAGIGFGGFCFPKDLAAFVRISEKKGYNFELLKAVDKINEEQKQFFLKKIKDALWNLKHKTIGVLGLSFKPNTDDIRFAPSIDIVQGLLDEGAKVKAFDPQAIDNFKQVSPGLKFCKDAYSTARGSDCLVILTEWNEFKELNLERIKKLLRDPIIIDGRNIYRPKDMKKLGFTYISIGRK